MKRKLYSFLLSLIGIISFRYIPCGDTVVLGFILTYIGYDLFKYE